MSDTLTTALVPYDVKLNGQKYILVPGSYRMSPVPESIARPGVTHGGDPTAKSTDDPAWAWWSQTLWQGDGVDDWKGDGGFLQGVGMDQSNDGQVTAAGLFSQVSSRATNTGYLFIPLTTTTIIAIDQADGNAFTSTDGITWTDRGKIGAAGASIVTNAWAFFKGDLVVSNASGQLRTSTDGITWATWGTQAYPSGSSAYVLGVYRSRLYVAWGRALYYIQISTGSYTALIPTASGGPNLDGTPIAAAAGSGVMYIIAQGTPAHLYMLQSDQLIELLQWPSDFVPLDCIFMDTLYVTGGTLDAGGGWSGETWRLNQNGLEFVYEVPKINGAQDYRIYSAYNLSGVLYFSFNGATSGVGAGVGVYDPTLDIYTQPALGSYIGSVTANNTNGLVKGISSWNGVLLIGISGLGIYRQSPTTFGNFKVTSSLFGSTSKRVNKMWGLAEVTFTPLTTGQSILVEYSSDGGTTWTTLGTKSYAASYTAPESSTKSFMAFPANYKSAVLQYRVTGTSNGAALALLDLSLSFIEASANPKRSWSLTLGLLGSVEKPMQYRDHTDFERTAVQMKAELDALWNVRFAFEDITGVSYNVMMPRVGVAADNLVRTYDSGDQTTLKFVQIKYSVVLVEV